MKKLVKVFFGLLLLASISQESFAGEWLWPSETSDVTWEGDNSNWENRFNYSNNQLPDDETNVIINPNNYTVAPALSSNSSFEPLGITFENGGSITLNGDLNVSLLEIGGGNNSITLNGGSQMTVADGIHFNSSGGSINISGDGDLMCNDDLTLDRANSTINNDGNLTINGDLIFDAANSTVNNDGGLAISGNLRTSGLSSNSNEVNNNPTGVLSVGGNINFSGAANDITNDGIFSLNGSFLGINIAGVTENTINGTWIWNYTGSTWDLDILSVFIDNGTFGYGANADQNIIPLSYSDLRIGGSGTKTLANDISISGTLTLNSGTVSLRDHDLTILGSGNISGGNAGSFILTDGAGSLIQQNIGSGGRTGDVLFPVGFTAGSYTPLTINNSSGTADDFSVRLVDAFYEDGSTGAEQISDVVDRTWFIDESIDGGSDATLTFQWNDAEGLGGFSPASMHVVHHNGSEWERLWSGVGSGSGPYTASASGVTDFSPFGIEGDASPLPVELVEFKAEYFGESVNVSWVTASEINNDYFILERSANLTDYEQIAKINGNGTTNEKMNYQRVDVRPYGGTSYYRLTQVDFDGTTEIHAPVKVEVPLGSEIQAVVFPSPSEGEYINIQLSGFDKSLSSRLKIVNIKGESVYEQDLYLDKNTGFNEKIEFNSKLKSGIYILNISTPQPIIKRIMVK